MEKRERARGYLAYAAICFFWGTSNLVTKIGVSALPTAVFASMRYLIAGLLLLLVALAKGQRFPRDKTAGRLLLIGVMMQFGTSGCVALSNGLIDSGIVTILLATVPIFTALLQAVILRTQHLGGGGWTGLGIGFLGIFLVAMSGKIGSISVPGVLLGALGAFLWAGGSLLSAESASRENLVAVTAVQMLTAAALFALCGLLSGSYRLQGLRWETLWPIFYLALEDSALGFLLYSWLLQVWDPLKAATYAYINPVVALLLGAWILGEPLTMGKILGMFLIFAAVYLIQQSEKKQKVGFVSGEKKFTG